MIGPNKFPPLLELLLVALDDLVGTCVPEHAALVHDVDAIHYLNGGLTMRQREFGKIIII
jgi:hypothetical protein